MKNILFVILVYYKESDYLNVQWIADLKGSIRTGRNIFSKIGLKINNSMLTYFTKFIHRA